MSTCAADHVRVFPEIQRLGAAQEGHFGMDSSNDSFAALPKLDDAAIEELRAMRRPPLVVRRLLEVTHQVLSAGGSGGAPRTVNWESVQRTLAAEDFPRRLRGYNLALLRSNQELARGLCRDYFSPNADPPLTYARARRACRAAGALFSWSAQVFHEVMPHSDLPAALTEQLPAAPHEELPAVDAFQPETDPRQGIAGIWRKSWMRGEEELQTDLRIREATHVAGLTEIVGWGYHNGDAYVLRGQLGADLSISFSKAYVTGPLMDCAAFTFEGGVDDQKTEVVGMWNDTNNFEMHHGESSSKDLPRAVLRAEGAAYQEVNGGYALDEDLGKQPRFRHLKHDIWLRRSICGSKWVFTTLATGESDESELYSCPDKVLNDVGYAMQIGGRSSSSTYYCGRRLGKAAIPGSDGRCGPTSGPQCNACRCAQETLLLRAKSLAVPSPSGGVFFANFPEIEPPPRLNWVHEGEGLSSTSVVGYWLIKQGLCGDDYATMHIVTQSTDGDIFEGRTSGDFHVEGQLHGRYLRFVKTARYASPPPRFLYEGILEGRGGDQIFGRWSEGSSSSGDQHQASTHLPPFETPWREFHGSTDDGGCFTMKRLEEWSFQLGNRCLPIEDDKTADRHLVEMVFKAEQVWGNNIVRCVRYRCPSLMRSVSEVSDPPFSLQLHISDSCLVEVEVELAGASKSIMTFQHDLALEDSFRRVSLPLDSMSWPASGRSGAGCPVVAPPLAVSGNRTSASSSHRKSPSRGRRSV